MQENNYSLITKEILSNVNKYKCNILENLTRGKETMYSLYTEEMLDRINKYKNDIINDMIVDANDIICGISIFEEILKNINPSVIDEDSIEKISNIANRIINNIEYNNQRVNFGMRSGIDHGICMLYILKNKDNKFSRELEKKVNN